MSANFYATPSYMTGGGSFTIYSGARRQRGGGVLGSLAKFIIPLGRIAASGIKNVAKSKAVRNIAKQAIAKGIAVGTGVAADALQGRNVGESMKERSRAAALEALTGAPAHAHAPPISRRKRKLKQKKRYIPPSQSQPKRKRRRKTASRRKELF